MVAFASPLEILPVWRRFRERQRLERLQKGGAGCFSGF